MKDGDIVKATLSQVVGKVKFRPVLLLKKMPPFDDWLVCGITSQTKNKVDNFDLLIKEEDSDFKSSGLIKTSLVRLGFLTVIPENIIEGTIGTINKDKLKKLIDNLVKHLKGFK